LPTRLLSGASGRRHRYFEAAAVKRALAIKQSLGAGLLPEHTELSAAAQLLHITVPELMERMKSESVSLRRKEVLTASGERRKLDWVPNWYLQRQGVPLPTRFHPARQADSRGVDTETVAATEKKHDEATMKVYRLCYLEYRLKGKPRRWVFGHVLSRYGYPKDEANITLFSKRYAKYRGFPKNPTDQERKKLLPQIEREIESEKVQ
jgi:hypothetical protein